MSAPILQYFAYEHLKNDRLKEVAQVLLEAADTLDEMLQDGPEKSVALRKLLEAKDAAVRAAL